MAQPHRSAANLGADPQIPRFAADGQSLLFSATPTGAAAGARQEVYHVNVGGTGLTCLTCELADPTPLRAGTTAPRELFKPVPFEDGSGRILMQSVDPATGSYTNVIYEPDNGQLVRVITPPGKPGVVVTDPQREMRISPDGTHVLFSQIELVPNPSEPPGFVTAVPILGTLTPGVDAGGNKVYNITDARVVYPVGEGKQFTHDGKGVIVQGGLYDAGNVDDVEVDLATGNVTRLTGNLDYDEDADLSPNNQWIAIDSGRGQEMLTPASRIVRPAFVPLLIQRSVYTAYAGTTNAQNVTNQPSVIAVADDLNREDGLPLFVDATTGHVIRTVVYTDYVNDEGMILNGTESTDQSAAQNTIHYVADITVSGTHTGSLTGDVTINKLTRTIIPTTANSQIQSTLDGDTQVLLASIGDDRAAV